MSTEQQTDKLGVDKQRYMTDLAARGNYTELRSDFCILRLSLRAMQVYIAMVGYRNWLPDCCPEDSYLTLKALSEKTEMDQHEVWQAINELKGAGVISTLIMTDFHIVFIDHMNSVSVPKM